MGSTGADVSALHDYFTRFGYFPNETLQRQFPNWRPIVAVAPRDTSVFDANTEAATRAFQRNLGLQETGIVDQATRAMLQKARCGVPDGIAPPDASEKWNLSNTGTWSHNNLTWLLDNTDNNTAGRRAAIEGSIAAVLSSWDAPSAYTFAQGTGTTADIHIKFSSSLASGTNASTTSISNGGDVTMNSTRTWTVGDRTTTGTGQMNMDSILIHELGHALGLAHSPYADAIMYPFFDTGEQPKTFLTVDDTTSILAMKSEFLQFDGQDHDIAYSRHPFSGERIWVVGGAAVGGGFQIWDLMNKVSWTLHPGGAVRIGVNPILVKTTPTPAAPWVVNNAGQVFAFNWTSGGWDIVTPSPCATDIAVGEDDSVWIIGCDSVGGGHSIYKQTAPRINAGPGVIGCVGPCFTPVPGGAVRIAVGPVSHADSRNVPWVTNNTNDIFRLNPDTNSFVQLPGKATDIAAGGGVAWSIGATAVPGGFNIQVWDEQDPGTVKGGPPPVARKTWVTVPGGATNISVADGRPVVINNAFNAFWTQSNP